MVFKFLTFLDSTIDNVYSPKLFHFLMQKYIHYNMLLEVPEFVLRIHPSYTCHPYVRKSNLITFILFKL